MTQSEKTSAIKLTRNSSGDTVRHNNRVRSCCKV